MPFHFRYIFGGKAGLPWSELRQQQQQQQYAAGPDMRSSRGSAVGIATAYEQDDRGVGVRVPSGSRIFTSPYRQDWLWGLPNLISNENQGLFPRE
jgi:hypothetical protein